MRRAQWIGALLGLVSIAALAAFSTTPSVGTGHRFWWSGTSFTGRIMGQSGDSLGVGGARYISATTGAATVSALRIAIFSKSINTSDNGDTLAPMGAWSGFYARGIDSLFVVANGNSNCSITVND